jgi:hypothetical protein
MSLLRSTTTGSGRVKAAWTAATASAGVRPPTLTPATRTPGGTVDAGAGGVGAVVVVVVVVVVVEVVVEVTVEIDVVTSAITGLESAPAAATPSTNKPAASRRFTATAV